jgi:hypothetical protein
MNRNNQRDEESLDDLEESDEDEVATDAMEASDQGRPWIPPIDPPAGVAGDGEVRVRAGFATSADDDLNDGASDAAGGERRSDDEITARVRRLLRTDAATAALRLEVETIDGVVYLRGEVDTLDDGDLAAEVASRVRGVEDVVDETWMRD